MAKSLIRHDMARRMGFAMRRHRDWHLSYLGLAFLGHSLGLSGAIVMGCDEE